MRPPRPLDLDISRSHGRRWSWTALVISILVHVLIFYGPIESRSPYFAPDRKIIIAVPPPTSSSDAPQMVYLEPRGNSREQLPPIRQPAVVSGSRPRPVTRVPEPPVTLRGGPVTPADSGITTPARRRMRPVGPAFGDGVAWVRPVPVSPEDLARHLERSHVEQVDSAVTAIMQAFLDSLANEPGAARKMPDWTTTLAGSKFGLDSRYIYVAGLKIPAAVLALLPFPGGNVSQDRALDHVIDMRADIEQAARRAQNMDDFKRAIREIRDRKQRERDFERAQREPPPPPDQPQPESQP